MSIKQLLINWLMKRKPRVDEFPPCDFDRILYEVRPCDVLLFEGQSRVSEFIKVATQSPWSHAALYIGKLYDTNNPIMRERICEHYGGSLDDQLIIESLLGQGTIVSPLEKYRGDHIRICRPHALSRHDAQKVLEFAIGRLGLEYNIRHNLDLARLLFPWHILPRRWRSTLFERKVGVPTKEICSSMLAEAFSSVHFPILPIIKSNQGEQTVRFYKRNPQLYTPRDFDYSPYFDIIKYPLFDLEDSTLYRNLPWQDESHETDIRTVAKQKKETTEEDEEDKDERV